MFEARQRAVDHRIEIGFDESESRAARETDQRQIGDAQPPRFAREERKRDDGQCFRQFLDRWSCKPGYERTRLTARIEERGYLLQQQREERCADAAVAEDGEEGAERQRDATADRPAFHEDDQEEDQQTETGPERKHVLIAPPKNKAANRGIFSAAQSDNGAWALKKTLKARRARRFG